MKCPECDSFNGMYENCEDYYLDEDYNEYPVTLHWWDCFDCGMRRMSYDKEFTWEEE